MNIGKRLKDLRKESGMTLKEVASLIGIKLQQVSKWENNITRPEYENLIMLAKIYNVSTDYILGKNDF